MNPKERLKLILKELNITPAELSRETGISKGGISDCLNPNNLKQPGGKFALALQKAFNVNPDYLLTGEGSMFIDEVSDEEKGREDCVKIPFLRNIKAAAGAGCYVNDEEITLYIEIKKEDVLRLNLDIKNCNFILVSGDSMTPFLIEGDKILVDNSKLNIIDGKIYVIREDDRIIVKKIQKVPNGIRVISLNKEYEPYSLIFEKDNFSICGQVMMLQRDLF